MTVAAADWPIDPLWLIAIALVLVVVVLPAIRRAPDVPPRPTRTMDGAARLEFERGVTDSLARGNKIEAIKAVRAALGLGLKDSKGIVDRIESGEPVQQVLQSVTAGAGNSAGPVAPPADVQQAARDALAQGDKIEAIRLVRQHTGMGLAEAKAYVEGL